MLLIKNIWNIFSMKMEDGNIKYKCLPELVKSALILPHGNADVERSLSVNTSVVTEDRPHIGEARHYSSYIPTAINLKKFPSQEHMPATDRGKEEKERQLKQ